MTALFQQKQQPTMFGPGSQMTVEGRIGGILNQDERGNYTNPVVKQAENRQLQAFNQRGLLNTSMASQGAQEAVISKAVEIATPDAKTAYDNFASNRDNYQGAMQTIATNYQRQLDTINASQMTPEDKSVAIAQAGSVRDGELAFQNNLFSRMPDWQQEWLAPAVNTAGMDINAVSNQDTLANIASDPAQAQAMRDQATERMRAASSESSQPWMPGGGGSMIGNSGVPSVGQAANGQPLPAYDAGGRYINWAATGFQGVLGTRGTLRDAYNDYVQWHRQYQNSQPMLSPMDWYARMLARGEGVSGGPGNGSNGEGAGTGGGVGAGGDNY